MKQRVDEHGRWQRYFNYLRREDAEREATQSGRICQIEEVYKAGYRCFAVWMLLEEGETQLPIQEIEQCISSST